MKLQQLRYVVEIVRHGNHLSAAADALNTSQPGVSRQIQLLELDLGFEIFQRTRNRIIGITEPGKLVLAIAQRVTTDIAALRSLKSDMTSGNRGTLTIGTTHTQARYVLPSVVETFIKGYPQVHLTLKQGDPEEICALVESGDADLAVGTETMREFPGLVQLPCFELPRSIIAPKGHPLLSIPELTVEEIAKYPIITYDTRYSGRWKVMKVFKDHGIEPKVSLSGIDADVCKTYVEKGLGVAILTTVTYDPERDVGLSARDASHLFPGSMIKVSLRPNVYLRPYLVDFIHAIAPQITMTVLRDALREAPARAGMY
jgi:LysR family cys regulon transcriptional activator